MRKQTCQTTFCGGGPDEENEAQVLPKFNVIPKISYILRQKRNKLQKKHPT